MKESSACGSLPPVDESGLLAAPNGLTDPETGLTFLDFNNLASRHNAKLSPPDQAAGHQREVASCFYCSPDFSSKRRRRRNRSSFHSRLL